MSTHNNLIAEFMCPRCGKCILFEVEMFAGYGRLWDYAIGDKLVWAEGRAPQHGGRPAGGNLDAEGYAVCPNCERDMFLVVRIRNDVISEVVPDPTKAPLIPD